MITSHEARDTQISYWCVKQKISCGALLHTAVSKHFHLYYIIYNKTCSWSRLIKWARNVTAGQMFLKHSTPPYTHDRTYSMCIYIEGAKIYVHILRKEENPVIRFLSCLPHGDTNIHLTPSAERHITHTIIIHCSVYTYILYIYISPLAYSIALWHICKLL